MVGPKRRVPSGNSTSGSPPSTTSMLRRSASRSAAPRRTGNAPSAEMNLPNSDTFQSESLPM